MTTEQWERENQDTLMEYFIDGDPSVRRIQCEYCRKVIYKPRPETANIEAFRACGLQDVESAKALKSVPSRTWNGYLRLLREAVLTSPGECRCYCLMPVGRKDYRRRKANAG